MERLKKLELIKRSLGLRHKLKVHESMKHPESHEELAISLIAKWELEDELRAIEELLAEERGHNVRRKREHYEAQETQPLPPVISDPLLAKAINAVGVLDGLPADPDEDEDEDDVQPLKDDDTKGNRKKGK